MTHPVNHGRREWWILGAGIVAAIAMLATPVAWAGGLAVAVAATVILVSRKPKRRGPLIAAIAVVLATAAALTVVGFVTLAAESTTDGEVTLIRVD